MNIQRKMIAAGEDIPSHLQWMYKSETTARDIINLLNRHEHLRQISTFQDILKALIKFPHFKKYKELRHVTVNRLRHCYQFLQDNDEALLLYKAVYEKILATYETHEKTTPNYRYMVQFLHQFES